jgi:hypothetical protein
MFSHIYIILLSTLCIHAHAYESPSSQKIQPPSQEFKTFLDDIETVETSGEKSSSDTLKSAQTTSTEDDAIDIYKEEVILKCAQEVKDNIDDIRQTIGNQTAERITQIIENIEDSILKGHLVKAQEYIEKIKDIIYVENSFNDYTTEELLGNRDV